MKITMMTTDITRAPADHHIVMMIETTTRTGTTEIDLFPGEETVQGIDILVAMMIEDHTKMTEVKNLPGIEIGATLLIVESAETQETNQKKGDRIQVNLQLP